MSRGVTSEQLYEWRESLAELDRLAFNIRGEEGRKRAAQIIDGLERELTTAYLDANAAEVRCACNVDTPDAPTLIDLDAAQLRQIVGGVVGDPNEVAKVLAG